MSNRADGTYPGTIVAAYVAEDQWDPGQYVLKLDVNLEPEGAVTCRVQLTDKDSKVAERRDAALKALTLPWPFKSADLAALKGKGIDVNLKTSKQGRQNAYVATMREEKVLSAEDVDLLIGNPSDVPF